MRDQAARKPKKQRLQKQSPTTEPRTQDTTASPATGQAVLGDAPRKTKGSAKALQRLQDLLQDDQVVGEVLHLVVESSPVRRRALAAEFTMKYEADAWTALGTVMERAGWTSAANVPESDLCSVVVDIRGIVEALRGTNNATGGSPQHPTMGVRQASAVVMHPVHICVSPLASKRDVLDYVTKNWRQIRSRLDDFGGAPRIRTRPMAERDRFIWKNRHASPEELEDMVSAKFPGGGLAYGDIHGILQKLKARQHKDTSG
jgi:hypothetical protein